MAVVERDEFRKTIPRWYRGGLHALFTYGTSVIVVALCWSRVRAVAWWEPLSVPLFFLLAGFIEHCEHRWLLHRNSWLGRGAFRIHTLEHHRFFNYEDFQPEDKRDYGFILFPPLLVVGYMLVLVPAFGAAFYFLVSPNVGFFVAGTGALYFFCYEVIHLASHLGDRFPVKWRWLQWMGEHHRIHHNTELMTTHNFNVVLPLYDALFGTLETKK